MKKVNLDNTQIPLHYQIADYLLIMLKRGELELGENLPPEEKLRELFGVSRTTIRRSLDHLLQMGLLKRKQGSGTSWTEKAGDLLTESKLAGLNRQIFGVSQTTGVKVLSKSNEMPPDEAIDFLNLRPGDEVVVFTRLRTQDNEPVSYTTNYILKKIGSQIEAHHLEKMTMLEALEKVVGVALGIIEHEAEITRASEKLARILEIQVLDPVLTIKTSVYDSEGIPIEVVWTHFVEDKYTFKVILDK
jgi:GntR family transcriptional regulator